MTLKPGTESVVEIVDLAVGGRGVARVDGFVVFVEGGLTGETARARVERVHDRPFHAPVVGATQRKAEANPVRRSSLVDRIGARRELNTHHMKPIDRIIRWGGLAAVIGLVCAMSPTAKQGGKTKPFKETGYEYFVTGVIPGSFQHPFYQAMREEWGRAEDWAGFLLQT